MEQTKKSCSQGLEDRLSEKPGPTESTTESQHEHHWEEDSANPANWASSRKAIIIIILIVSNLIWYGTIWTNVALRADNLAFVVRLGLPLSSQVCLILW